MRFGARLAEECPEVGAALREQFAVVLLDEYQDTSVAQRRLLTGLFGGGHPVTAVGDPLQAIYGWRGASVANIDDFPVHFAPASGGRAPVLPLAENRRSGRNVLDSANLVAADLRAQHPEVAALVAADPDKPPGAVRLALHPTYAEEIDWLADQVVGEIAASTAPGDVALLVRAGSDLPPVMAALADRGVPFEVRGVDGLLAVPEVAEVLAVLDVLHDSTANPALVRLLAGPRWRIGPRDLALLGRRARQLTGGRMSGRGPRPPAAARRLGRRHRPRRRRVAARRAGRPGRPPVRRRRAAAFRRAVGRDPGVAPARRRPAARPRPPGRHHHRSRHRARGIARARGAAPGRGARVVRRPRGGVPGRGGRVLGHRVPVVAAPRRALRQGARARASRRRATPSSS